MWQMCHVRKFPTWHICHLRKCHLFCFCFFSSLQKLKKERNYKLSIYYKCNPSYITWKKKKKKKKKKLPFFSNFFKGKRKRKRKKQKLPFSNVVDVPR
jgi:hypothetical protein